MLLLAAQRLFATDRAWNGGTTVWATPTNWTGNIAPGSTDNAVFNSTFTNQPTLGATATVGGLWMTGGIGQNVTIGGAFALTLSGNTINGTAGLGILVDNANAFSLTINAPITLGAAQSWINNSANLLTLGAVSLTTKALTVNGSGNTTIAGVVTSSNGNGTLTKSGSGTLTLSGTNTFSGQLTVASGTLSIATINNVSANGTLGNSALPVILGSAGSVTGTLEYSGATASSTKTFSLALGGTGSFQVDAAGTTLTLSGVISGSGGLQKTGAGTLTLSGVNTYSGGTTLNGGTTIINGVSSLGLSTSSATINAATLDISASFTSTRNYVLGNASSTVLVDPTFTLTANGIFSSTGTLNKTGTGTLVLGGVNTYSGATNISAGTLREGLANVIPDTSAVTVASGATYDLNTFSETIGSLAGAGTVTSGAVGALTLTAGGDNTSTLFSGVLQNGSGTFSLTKSGTGALTLSGANTYTGLTTVSGGTLVIQNATALGTTTGATTVSSGATLQLQSSITVGAEPLTLNGAGVSSFGAFRNLSGNNSFAGAITLASASTIYSDAGTLTLGGGITNGGFASTFNGAGNINESGAISGSGGLTKNGSGTLTLGGANAYLGTTTINGGSVVVSSNGNLGGLASTIVLNAGTLEIATGFTTARAITLGDPASTFQVDAGQTFTVSTAIIGTGALNKTGAGTMVLSAANTFSGGTSVTGGTLQLGLVNGLLASASLTIGGGTFDLQTFGQTTGAVTLSSGSIVGTSTLTASTYTLQSGTVSAILAGNGTVTKNTAGTVTLSGANTFTGSTTISAGTLQVNTNNALGTAASGTTVASGAVLRLNNVNYSTAEPLTLNGTGISNGGALVNSSTSTFAGSINVATNATINAGGGTLNLTGGISKNGTTLTIAGGGTVNITTNGITGSLANSDLVVDGTTVVLSAASSYNGPTTIQNSGTLKLGGNNMLPTSPQTAMTINTSSIFDLASYSDGVASLTGDSTATVKNSVAGGTSTLTINPASGSTTFAGIIAGTNGGTQGNIALQKNGAGTLILTGANTYSGSTIISGGTLTASNSSGSALGSTSAITVNSSGTLLLGASNQINNAATMTLAGGTFALGGKSEGAAGTTGVGLLTLTATSIIDFSVGATSSIVQFAGLGAHTAGTLLQITNWDGTPATGGGTERLLFTGATTDFTSLFAQSDVTFNGLAGYDVVQFSGYYEITAVPEPATWVAAALALGIAGLHLVRRRRAKANCTSVV